MKISTSYFAVLFLFLAHVSYGMDGNIAVWENGKREVKRVHLPTADGLKLSNHLVSIMNLPANLSPNEPDCYCFKDNDPRFAYVHAFYYANDQIKETNRTLKKLSLG